MVFGALDAAGGETHDGGEFVHQRDPNRGERAAGAASRRVKRKRGSRGRAQGFIDLEKIS